MNKCCKECKTYESYNKEKEDYPTYKTTGGYLKSFEYKEMWAIFWRKTDEENKKKFLNLPNFDAKIFEEVTGINVDTKTLLGKKVKVELDGQSYTATID